MLDKITKYEKTGNNTFQLTVLIPSWNNLLFLKNCLTSIQKNSVLSIQPIVFVNDGVDGTLEWLQQHNIDFVHATENVGICYGLNLCRSLVKSFYIVYMNDDMYVLPNWDIVLWNEIEKMPSNRFMLSATMIEPIETGNKCVVVSNYGTQLETFEEDRLLKEYTSLQKENWTGSSWPPNLVHVDLWDLIGGYSIEFSPGMYSDPDFSRKLYEVGVRVFKGVGASLVYHFGSKTTKRVKKNKGKKTFILKWGLTTSEFYKEYLQLGQSFKGEVTPPQESGKKKLIRFLKRIRYSF